MKEAIKAREAKFKLLEISEGKRVETLNNIAMHLTNNIDLIIRENQKDLTNAKANNLSSALIDRLEINEDRIENIIQSVREIAKQPQVVGEIIETSKRSDGLIINKQRIPIGVIGMIFESRPNVVVDCSCLAIKSGNCIILKGGKEAEFSNKVLVSILRDAIKDILPMDSIQLINSREDVNTLLTQKDYVDVIIPRGGENLINFVYKNSLIPVIAHFKGLCHIYLDKEFDIKTALEICINAKLQRPGVCNAMETLLINKDISTNDINFLLEGLKNLNCEIRVCENTKAMTQGNFQLASAQDWETEYLDKILSVKLVGSTKEAIEHIQKFGSNHTEAILSKSKESIEMFKNQIDASSIMVNASTRFNDGGEYGLGAELGISTTKLHAYGPMGAKEMTTSRFLVEGQGHIRK